MDTLREFQKRTEHLKSLTGTEYASGFQAGLKFAENTLKTILNQNIVLIIENFNFKKDFKDLKDCIDFLNAYAPSGVLSVKVLRDNEVIFECEDSKSFVLDGLKFLFLKGE